MPAGDWVRATWSGWQSRGELQPDPPGALHKQPVRAAEHEPKREKEQDGCEEWGPTRLRDHCN